MLPPNFRKVAFVFDRSISIAFKSGLYGGRYVPRGCNWGVPYFNSRPSARGDGDASDARLRCHISIPAPLRGATRSIKRASAMATNFNSRPSARGDPMPMWFSSVSMNFNSRPSARGDTSPPSCSVRLIRFQFSPLREGRRRITTRSRRQCQFQFSPLREGRQHWRRWWTRRANFNFRPSARGEKTLFSKEPIVFDISILAPPRGATQC